MRTRPVLVLALVLSILSGAAWPVPARAVPVESALGLQTPAAQLPQVFNIGVFENQDGVDGYYPGSVVVDNTRQFAYVYNTDSAERRPVISVLDLRQVALGQPGIGRELAPRQAGCGRGGNARLDLGVAPADDGPCIAAEPEDLRALGGPEAVADVRFEHKGCHGEVKLSWLSKFTPRFEVVGDRARVQGGIYDTDSVLLTTNAGRKKRLKLPSFPRSYHDIAWGMVGNFLDSMAGTAQPLVSGRDALPSIEFIDQCYREATRFDMPWYDLLRLPVPVSPAEVGHGL